MLRQLTRGYYAAARIHHASWQRGGGLAAARRRAAIRQAAAIGVLMNIEANDPQASAEMAAFAGALQKRGWILGSNLRIEYRWGAGNASRYHKFAAELVALSPDVILATGGTAVGALQQASRTVPIVFVDTTDPVNRGLIATMARPVATRQDLCNSNSILVGNGWICSKRFPQACRAWQLSGTRVQFSGEAPCRHPVPRRLHLEWR